MNGRGKRKRKHIAQRYVTIFAACLRLYWVCGFVFLELYVSGALQPTALPARFHQYGMRRSLAPFQEASPSTTPLPLKESGVSTEHLSRTDAGLQNLDGPASVKPQAPETKYTTQQQHALHNTLKLNYTSISDMCYFHDAANRDATTWSVDKETGRCYGGFSFMKTMGKPDGNWIEAFNYCLDTAYGTLATIHTESEDLKVRTLTTTMGDDCWLGLRQMARYYDDTNESEEEKWPDYWGWLWVDEHSPIKPTTYSRWRKNNTSIFKYNPSKELCGVERYDGWGAKPCEGPEARTACFYCVVDAFMIYDPLTDAFRYPEPELLAQTDHIPSGRTRSSDEQKSVQSQPTHKQESGLLQLIGTSPIATGRHAQSNTSISALTTYYSESAPTSENNPDTPSLPSLDLVDFLDASNYGISTSHTHAQLPAQNTGIASAETEYQQLLTTPSSTPTPTFVNPADGVLELLPRNSTIPASLGSHSDLSANAHWKKGPYKLTIIIALSLVVVALLASAIALIGCYCVWMAGDKSVKNSNSHVSLRTRCKACWRLPTWLKQTEHPRSQNKNISLPTTDVKNCFSSLPQNTSQKDLCNISASATISTILRSQPGNCARQRRHTSDESASVCIVPSTEVTTEALQRKTAWRPSATLILSDKAHEASERAICALHTTEIERQTNLHWATPPVIGRHTAHDTHLSHSVFSDSPHLVSARMTTKCSQKPLPMKGLRTHGISQPGGSHCAEIPTRSTAATTTTSASTVLSPDGCRPHKTGRLNPDTCHVEHQTGSGVPWETPNTGNTCDTDFRPLRVPSNPSRFRPAGTTMILPSFSIPRLSSAGETTVSRLAPCTSSHDSPAYYMHNARGNNSNNISHILKTRTALSQESQRACSSFPASSFNSVAADVFFAPPSSESPSSPPETQTTPVDSTPRIVRLGGWREGAHTKRQPLKKRYYLAHNSPLSRARAGPTSRLLHRAPPADHHRRTHLPRPPDRRGGRFERKRPTPPYSPKGKREDDAASPGLLIEVPRKRRPLEERRPHMVSALKPEHVQPSQRQVMWEFHSNGIGNNVPVSSPNSSMLLPPIYYQESRSPSVTAPPTHDATAVQSCLFSSKPASPITLVPMDTPRALPSNVCSLENKPVSHVKVLTTSSSLVPLGVKSHSPSKPPPRHSILAPVASSDNFAPDLAYSVFLNETSRTSAHFRDMLHPTSPQTADPNVRNGLVADAEPCGASEASVDREQKSLAPHLRYQSPSSMPLTAFLETSIMRNASSYRPASSWLPSAQRKLPQSRTASPPFGNTPDFYRSSSNANSNSPADGESVYDSPLLEVQLASFDVKVDVDLSQHLPNQGLNPQCPDVARTEQKDTRTERGLLGTNRSHIALPIAYDALAFSSSEPAEEDKTTPAKETTPCHSFTLSKSPPPGVSSSSRQQLATEANPCLVFPVALPSTQCGTPDNPLNSTEFGLQPPELQTTKMCHDLSPSKPLLS